MNKRKFCGGVAALLLAACAADGPDRVVEKRIDDAPAHRGEALLRRAMIDGHNAARLAAGVGPVVWDDRLAADARAYARVLAKTGRFEHAFQPQGLAREGENLWVGTRDAYDYREMIGHWVAEKRDFMNGVTPAFSRTGKWEDVVHYTQIVWRGSARIGCAMASDGHDDYLVCRYSPVGNVVGERTF